MNRVLNALLLAAALTACSSSETKTPAPSSSGGSSGTASSSGGSSSGDTTSSTSSSGSAATTLKAPKIDEVAKMMGALHVMWTNDQADCDSIVGERKAEMSDGSTMEKYKVVFTVPGEADNKHDTSATEDMKYTYRLRCKKGDAFSDYSNEMGLNPVQ